MPTTAKPAIRELVTRGTPVVGYIHADAKTRLVASLVIGTGMVAVEVLSADLLPEHIALAAWYVDLLEPVLL